MRHSLITSLREHWPEYLMEAALLGGFMISACVSTVLLEHPDSPVHALVSNGHLRRAIVGVMMGLTAALLIYSPWGQRSGAHMNPAVTLTFLRLGRANAPDALFYIVAQFAGGTAGVMVSQLFLRETLAHPLVSFGVTTPGPTGVTAAFLAELAISCGMMLLVLFSASAPAGSRRVGVHAGILVALYITFEAPLSGMSMNPARTFASALPSGIWTAFWIYLIAPVLGMFAAVELYRVMSKSGHSGCAKLDHGRAYRCLFCGYKPSPGSLPV